MGWKRPGTALVLAMGLCAPARSGESSPSREEQRRAYGGWYSSGTRHAPDGARTEPHSLPHRRAADVDSPLIDHVPTPIVPYHSTLYGSSRSDLPRVPSPPAQQTAAPQHPWNVTTPPVVDLGRDLGVPAPREAEVRPAVTAPAGGAAAPKAPEILPAGELVPVELPNLPDVTDYLRQGLSKPAATSREPHRTTAPPTPIDTSAPTGKQPATNAVGKAATMPVDAKSNGDARTAVPAKRGDSQVAKKQASKQPAPAATAPAVESRDVPQDRPVATPVRREIFALPQPAIPLEGRRIMPRRQTGFTVEGAALPL